MNLNGQTRSTCGRFRSASAVIGLVLAVYWVALFYGTHMRLPTDFLPGQLDKVIHFASYAGLGVLLLSLRAMRGTYPWTSVFRRWLLLAGYGAFDELSQMPVNRTPDVKDWFADIVGAACGLGLVTFVVWRICRATASRRQSPAADAIPG